MLDIDYGTFLPGAPAVNPGRKLLLDTFQQIAEARERKRQADMADARARDASQLTFQSSMYGHDIAKAHYGATEEQARQTLAETERNHRAGERQKMTDAQAKLYSNPKFQEALQSQDPRALEAWRLAAGVVGAPIENEMGRGDTPPELAGPGQASVEPPPLTPEQAEGAPMQAQAQPTGKDIDDANEVLDVYQPMQKTGRQTVAGYTFDPKMNADLAMARAKQAKATVQGMAGEITDPMTATATKNAGVRLQALMALGYSEKDALDKLGAGIDAEAGRANARRNTDVGAARARTMTPNQQNDNERGWHGQAESTLQRYYTSQGYNGQVTALRNYENMLGDLQSGNSALQMGGLGAWVKEKSGGSAVITENEIKRYLQSSIKWTDEVARQFNYWVNRDTNLDPNYVQPFVDGLKKVILQRQRGIIDHIGKGAQATLLADPNPEVRSMADSAYQRAITPLMSPEQLDEYISKRKSETGGAPAPAKTPAGAPKKLTPADQKLADMAKARLAKNPNDTVAKQWLEAHGL